MPPKIEINYLDSNKPRGMVGSRQQVKVNTPFQVFSHDGPLTFRFKAHAPFEQDPGDLTGGTDVVPTRVGVFKFKCRILVNGQPVELDPDMPEGTGGELEIIP